MVSVKGCVVLIKLFVCLFVYLLVCLFVRSLEAALKAKVVFVRQGDILVIDGECERLCCIDQGIYLVVFLCLGSTEGQSGVCASRRCSCN